MRDTSITFGKLTSVFGRACRVCVLLALSAAVPADAVGAPTGSAPPRRTTAQINALIDKAGRSRPDWWDSVPLQYPKTLDMSWPAKPPGGWNAHRNVGQYMWSIINENPGRWRSGTRFMHYLLGVHRDNPQVLTRAIGQLAHCYQDLLRDWPRAAFWRRKQLQREANNLNARIRLAECYFKLGSKSMATAELNKVRRYVSPGMIKLWAEMGEMRKALLVARGLSRYYPAMANLTAGNACRHVGRYDDAVKCYQAVLAVSPAARDAKRIQSYQDRARACIAAIKQFEALDLARVADGTHTGTATAYAGPLTVAVTVKGGKIISVKVTRHKDKQYYGAITDTPAQIVARQGFKGVDAVTSATITSEAIINATARALAGAVR